MPVNQQPGASWEIYAGSLLAKRSCSGLSRRQQLNFETALAHYTDRKLCLMYLLSAHLCLWVALRHPRPASQNVFGALLAWVVSFRPESYSRFGAYAAVTTTDSNLP